jgi:hypothetical protein
MHPPSINFPQLPQFHKYWCSHFHPIWKKVGKKIVYSSNISKIPEFILNKEIEHRKKEKKEHRQKKRKEEKLQKSLSFEKRRIQYIERRKHFKKISMWVHFLSLDFTTSKTLFPNHLKILDSFEPSLSLAIYLTWVAFFSYAWAPHIYPLGHRKKKKYLFEPRWGNTYQKSAQVPKFAEPSYHYLSE